MNGPSSEPSRVAPPPPSPLATIDRDAGVGVQLTDGSMLWLFGDTAARDDSGQLTYFVIGTASWAPSDQPTATRDALDPTTAEPVPFATPTPDFPSCPAPDQVAGMWPSAAVVQPVGNRDRVLVWMENVCLGSDKRLDDAGMSLAEWWYDPASPPDGQPITATILQQRLFETRSFGSAVVASPEPDDDTLYVYRCVSTTDGGQPQDYGPCFVARTTVADAADASTYREWDGSAYAADVGRGVPLSLSGGRSASHPPAGFSVAVDPNIDGLVMVYSPWPGPSPYAEVRIAERPEGPWSEPITVTLTGCDDNIGQRRYLCYAANAQPWRSEPGRLGIGYYDSHVETFPVRGTFQVATVPIEVS